MTNTVYKGAYLPNVAGDSGVWGGYLNTLTFVTFDNALGAYAAQSLTSVPVTLSATQAGSALLRLTGTLTANVAITTSTQGFQFVENLTTGAFTVTISNGAGTPLTLPQGTVSPVIVDATNGARLGIPPTSSTLALTTLSVSGLSTLTGGAALGAAATLTEIATPSAPSAGTMQLYAISGDYIASQTPGGVQIVYGKLPTIQPITASVTYTRPSGLLWAEIAIVGGGAAGQGGTAGGTTSFGSWTALGGSGQLGGTGGANGSGTLVRRVPGNGGGGLAAGGGAYSSAAGAPGPWGGSGGAQQAGGAAANSGAGGGTVLTSGQNPYGGGSGEYVEFIMTAAQLGATVSCTIGAGGTAGGDGYAGGSGSITVKEHYN